MAQDYYDPLEPFDFMVKFLDDHKAELGVKRILKLEEDLVPEYPAILVNMEGSPLNRAYHATQMFLVTFHLDIWIFHAQLTVGKAVRSRKDIQLATEVRKLIHTRRDMDGHIIDGFVDGEYPGRATRMFGRKATTIVTTRLTWRGENRVLYQDS